MFVLLRGPSQTYMQRIQIRPLTGTVNLTLNIAALGVRGMEEARWRGGRDLGSSGCRSIVNKGGGNMERRDEIYHILH